jgi:hypothetical protein
VVRPDETALAPHQDILPDARDIETDVDWSGSGPKNCNVGFEAPPARATSSDASGKTATTVPAACAHKGDHQKVRTDAGDA